MMFEDWKKKILREHAMKKFKACARVNGSFRVRAVFLIAKILTTQSKVIHCKTA